MAEIEEIIHETPINNDGNGDGNKTPEISAIEDKFLSTVDYFRDPDNPKYETVERDILATGMSIPDFKLSFIKDYNSRRKPGEPTMEDMIPTGTAVEDLYKFKNSVWDDFATHFQGGLNRVGYGLGVVIPGVAASSQKSGQSPEWITDWIDTMGEWHEESKERSSDESNQSFFETGNLRAFAGGMGSGLASMAPMVLSFIPYVGKVAYMATTFSDIFGSILENGKANGLSIESSARMAIGLAIPITALEKIGMKGVTGPMKKSALNYLKKGGLNIAIKQAAKSGTSRIAQKEFLDFVKVGIKDIGRKAYAKRKVGAIAKAFGKGAGTEGVTETLQSVLEQSGEQIWDIYFSDKDATVGKGKYGTDIKSREFWLQAAEEGFYGAILGGVMSGGGAARHGIQEQSAYHYVRTSLAKGKPENIEALKNYSEKLMASGKISEVEHGNFVSKVDQMVKYEGQMWHKMDSPSAKFQSYNQMVTRDKATEVLDSEWLQEQGENYPDKKAKIEELAKEVHNDAQNIVQAISDADAQVIQKRKEHGSQLGNKIEKMIFTPKEKYHYNSVDQLGIAPNLGVNIKKLNNLLPEELRINPINNEQAENEGKIQSLRDGKGLEPSKPFGKVFKIKNDEGNEVILTEQSLTDEGKAEIIEGYNKAQESKTTKEEKAAIIEKIGNKYGINADAITHIALNPTMTEEGLSEVKSEEVLEEEEKTEDEPNLKITYKPTDKFSQEEKPTSEVGKLINQIETQEDLTDKDLIAIQEEADEKDISSLELVDAIARRRIEITGKQTYPSVSEKVKALDRTVGEMEGKKVIKDGVIGVIKKENNGMFVFESEKSIYEISKDPKTKLSKEGVKIYKTPKRKIKQKDVIEIVDEDNVLINGESYFITTDSKGNIVSLKNENRTIRKKSIIIEAEVQRNKLEKEVEQSQVDDLNSEINNKLDISFDEIKTIDNLLDENLTDEIAEILNEGLPDNVSSELMQKIDYYIDNVLENIERNFSGNEYAESIADGLLDLKIKIDEQYETNYREESEIDDEVQAKEESTATEKPRSPKEQEEVEGTLTEEEQVEIDEKVAENTEAEKRKLNKLKAFAKPKEQRKGVSFHEANLIKNNPKLYTQIKNHFKKIFPFISVKEVNNLGEKYGAKILARIVGSGIEIDPNEAIQTSLIHEYGHVFLEMLGDNHPLVKLGYKLVKDTQFFEDAQKLYPDKSEAEQLNEALNEMIATSSLEELKIKLDGSKLAKVQLWLKSIWSKLKKLVGRANANDISRILSRQMTLSKKPFKVEQGSLVGLDKDQRNPIVNIRLAKATDTVYAKLVQQLLDVVSDKTATFNYKNSNDASMAAYYSLMERYFDEKDNPELHDVKVFNGINYNLGYDSLEDIAYSDIQEFETKLKELDSELYETANTVVNSMFKSNLELDEMQEVIEDSSQSDTQEEQASNNAIKATKRVSLSVRSILSTIVGVEGYKIGSDAVFSYIANVAEKTYKKAGLIKALEVDASKDPIAKRVLDILEVLKPRQKTGFLQEISSLVQIKYEGFNFSIIISEDGSKKYVVTNPIRNKDRTYNGLEDRLSSLTKEQKEWLKHDNIINYDIAEFYTKGIETEKFGKFLKGFSEILNMETITSNDLKNIIDSWYEGKKSKLQNFFYDIGGQYDSLHRYSKGDVKFSKITGYLDKIFNGLGITLLSNSSLNGANNSVTSTQLGNWISTFNSMLMNKESGRVEAMSKSPIYENNPVFNYFKENGKVNYSVFDSTKNFITGENIEYKDMTDRDYMMLQLGKFATSSSNKYYSQTLGVKSNRQSLTFFEVPSYTDKNGKFDKSKLTEAYNNQVKMLEGVLKPMLAKAKTDLTKKDLIEDFNDLYIHTADSKGNITSGYNVSKHKEAISEIKIIAKANGLNKAFDGKIGAKKQFSSFDEMVENFFFIEAVNRSSLNDIYGGSALEYANLVAGKRDDKGNRKGRGTQQTVKRASSSDSNGKQIEIDKPIHYIVFDSGISGADSFKFNGTHLTSHIDKETGDLDLLGINSKELAFQVDPKTSQTVYIKTSGLNLKVKKDENGKIISTNLDGFGDNMKAIAKAMLAVEKKLATEEDPNPYVVFMDSSASKGTYKFKTVNFQDVMNGDLSSIDGNVNTIQIDNLTTPFNLNKDLSKVEEQQAILSTQAAIIQFNATQDISSFEEAAVEYLRDKMKNKFSKKNVIEELLSFSYVNDELTKDLNEREKSATTEILEAIKEHNENNPENQIKSFDHSSLRLIYEQFVASRLSKKGTRVEMSGNFMHQLPDMGGNGRKLKDGEIAVSWKMFGNTREEADRLLQAGPLEVVNVRIPSSAEMSMEPATVAYFLDTEANVVVLSDEFVRRSDSDHDGDKVMVYRKDIKDGEFVGEEDSFKTKMFNRFHENVTSPEFKEKQDSTLELQPLYDAVGDRKTEFKIATLKDLVGVAIKMGLGQIATGRFAIASKLTSLLSQSNEGLIKPIKYAGKSLQAFTNKSLDDIAILLQAALDIGNDPILTETGFNETTINVGNVMLSLGLKTNDVIVFLKLPGITNMIEDFKSKNLSLSEKKKLSFNSYFTSLLKNRKGKFKSVDELAETVVNKKVLGKNGAETLMKFQEFKKVSDDLNKMIGYIQLDKGLPNNAELNRKLLNDIASFGALSFTTNRLTARDLMQHRVEIAKAQKEIYQKHLLTSNSDIVEMIEEVSQLASNPFEFKKKVSESILKIFSQKQIITERDNVKEWFYDFANKMRNAKIGNTDLIITDDKDANNYTKNIYNRLQDNPLETKEEAIERYTGDASVIPKYLDLLNKYENAVNEINDVDKFKDNAFFNYLQFTVNEEKDGEVLMRLDPKFKATSQIVEDIKNGFKEIQDIDPQLANDIIDYQLYRYGTNNKIGSLIDVLPQSINVNQLIDTTTFKNSIENIPSVDAKIMIQDNLVDNIIADNIDLLESDVDYNKDIERIDNKNADWFIPKEGRLTTKDGRAKYVVYDNNAYKYNVDSNTYLKINVQSDENFTAFRFPKSTTPPAKTTTQLIEQFDAVAEETTQELIDNEKLSKLTFFKKQANIKLKNVTIYDDGTFEITDEFKSVHGDSGANDVRYMAQNMGIKENIKGKDSSVELDIEFEYNEDYIVPLNNLKLNEIAEKDYRMIVQLENAISLSGASQTIPNEGEPQNVQSVEEAKRRLAKYAEDFQNREREEIEYEELKYIYSYKVAKEKSKNKKEKLIGIEDAVIIDEQQIKDEMVMSDGSILTLPNESTVIDLGPKGNYSITPDGNVINNRNGNTVPMDSPIYFDVIAKYQENQADNEQNNCS